MAGRGLEEVVAAQTALSHVYGDEGRLIYRGYEIQDLAEHVSFEEVCYLLWFGELPTRAQLEGLRRELNESVPVDKRVFDGLRPGARQAHPMTQLEAGVALLATLDEEAESMNPAANQRKSIRLSAQTITLTAGIARLQAGQEPLAPRPGLTLAEQFLYLLRGELPDALSARIVDVALILHAEHGMNASTFAARVAAATLTDLHSAVLAALATLKGPLHGGANEQVMAMLKRIGSPERADAFVRDALARGEKVMGFGHRVYRTTDPRAPILKSLAEQLSARNSDGGPWLAISERVQATMREEMDRLGKKVYPNVDFFSASVYFTLGIPQSLFTNIFACARMAGWTAHVIEQYANNRLIRPQSEYTGPSARSVTPLSARN
ncbi:MAG: citrate/2-methylcitrate synthase [Longimicrobiales bacterium]